ncbi:MAG: biotin--[Bacteroidales bacterium]|nr:biotin--[acetyl-CoA-carboxylase] ligase [Bacteroidales bacterium]
MKNHKHYTQTTSTNTLMREMLQENPNLPAFSVVSAGFQTQGRGQRQNVWESEQDKNLLFSLLIRPQTIPATKAFVVSQIVSVAIANILSRYIKNIAIKWPNDIYCGDKKICGILIENSLMGNNLNTSIVGVGININQREFSSFLPNPTSLAMLTKQTYCLQDILKEVVGEIEQQYECYISNGEEQIEALYHSLLYRRNAISKFKIHNTSYSGGENIQEATIIGVEPNGCLKLKHADDTIHSYAFKEVEYII